MQVLSNSNEASKNPATDSSIVTLFEQQVGNTPGAVAVMSGERQVSYQELNDSANQLAHFLREQGVGPEVLVGILLERSVEMVVALLATLKAGGAYVSLDPAYPPERISFMLQDAATPIVLTQRRWRDLLNGTVSEIFELDDQASILAQQAYDNLDEKPLGENLAYVLYTSGSTGKPKGVAIEHRNVATLLFWARDTFKEEDLAGVLASTSICFDLSVFEIFAPLCRGGTVILIASALDFGTISPAAEITLINTVPSAMTEMLRVGVPDSVRTINLAGEPLKSSLVQQIFELTNARRVFNLYGPSEDTTYSTAAEIPRGRDSTSPSIGHPLSHKQIHVLDEKMQPVCVGATGEMYIGGDGLARGYLNRPDLTAEKFVPDPHGRGNGLRLYKTGDLARYRPDGELEFLGRVDNQVKLRGYRIELGEIEAVLECHPDIREAVVVAREFDDGDRRLIAYLIAKGECAPSATELRRSLREILPDYMIPASFITLNQFPMTPNGKVDRQALPAPNPARPALDQVFTAPVTPAAKKMTAIWNQILKVERVGIDDNFFDLGGDSLLATQIVSQIQSEFQTAIPLRTIFEHPTIASLTSLVEDKINNGSVGPPRVDLPTAPRHESQLSYSQQLMWMLQQFEPTASIYNIPLVIRLNGHLNKSALEQSLNEILRRHEVLRAVFADASGRPVQRFSQPDLKELRPLSLTHLTKREQQVELQRVIEEELEHPFELSQGPLLRTVLIQLSEAEHVLIVSMHHIVSDGWSVDILIRELTALYEAYVNQRPSPLKELPMQYADFASLQREWLQSETLDKHLEYWQEQLSGMLPVLDLPTDRPRSPVQTFRGAVHRLELNTSLVEALQDLGRTEGATLFMVLLAAFNAVLHRYTGQEDICVGSPIAGRHWAETENMIGPFLNTLVLRTDVSGDPTFRELLRRVREIALGAFEHQDLPFGLLLERLPIERSLSRTPLFQVMLNMLNYENQRVRLEVSGLSIDVTEILEHGSKFDLTLYVRQLDNTLSLNLVYNSDLFDEAHSIAFLNHFRALLESVVSYPEHSLSRLPLLDTTEREQISRGKIGPANNFIEFKDEDIEQPIARRFEQQVNTYPQNVAVKTLSFRWTYEELNRIANRVARSVLLRNGPAAEQVALLFKHDAPMVAAILGALKAGKTYVPLDTGYPVKRLSYMLQDSQAKLILTNNKSLALANALAVEQVPVINIDEIGDLPVDDINLPVTPESLAYILYTSGTTGEPKGVVQNHRNVLHHIRCYTNGLHITPEDRLTLLSSYSFDAAIMDIFGALLNGAGLYPVDLRDGGVDQLYECIADDEITIYHSTPTVYRYFAGGLNDSDVFPQLRLVVLGGEEVVPADVGLFKKQFPSECILVNGFGPTESTVSLRYFINRDTEVTRSTVPMGYPVEHTEVLILDEAGEPVLPHAVGEIAIRGKHVALGYWQREELTRKAFLPGADHKITYRTGDLGRLLADGSIEFRGRKDSQTKVRGHRVETSEIEAVLREHPAIVEAAAVVDSETNEGDARLVAYIVPDEEMPPLVSEIRAHLKNKLPDYMLPSLFIFVDAMALTSNGKLDRRSLPAPYQIRPESPTPYAAPRTPQEETLADIWAQLLHVDRIGIDDNFFELGGDSLMIFQLISRIHEVFSIRLPMRTLLEKSTIAEQAELLKSHED